MLQPKNFRNSKYFFKLNNLYGINSSLRLFDTNNLFLCIINIHDKSFMKIIAKYFHDISSTLLSFIIYKKCKCILIILYFIVIIKIRFVSFNFIVCNFICACIGI